MPCKVHLGDRVAQTACGVLFGYLNVAKRQDIPGRMIYPFSRSTELSKRLSAVMSLWLPAILKHTMLEMMGHYMIW